MARSRNRIEHNDDGSVTLQVRCTDHHSTGVLMRKAFIDAADLELVMAAIRGRWYANPTKPAGKYYVNGKRDGHTILLHRVILGNPRSDVHHVDNDGLNNRRANLWTLTHQENMRQQWPEKDWKAYDAEAVAVRERKTLVAVGKEIAVQFGLTRQQMWNIRKGYTKDSPAAIAYRNAIKAS